MLPMKGITIFDAHSRHDAEEIVVFPIDEVRELRILISVEIRSDPEIIGPDIGEGCPDLPNRVDELAPPGRRHRGPGGGAADAAHEAGSPVEDDAGLGDAEISRIRNRQRIVLRRLAAEAGHVHVEGELAADGRGRETLVVVEDRSDDRLLLLPIVAGQGLEIIAPHVEVGAIALALEEEGRDRFLDVVRAEALAADLVVRQEPLVRQQGDVPAPAPVLVDVEEARRLERAAEVAVACAIGAGEKGLGLPLRNAGRPHVVGAVLEPVAPFDLAEHALPAQEGRGDCQIVVRRDRPEERDGCAVSDRGSSRCSAATRSPSCA